MIIRLRPQVEAVTDDIAQASRKSDRHKGIALDDACVAVGCFLARAAPIDEDNRLALLPQMDSRANPDHAGAKNDNIGMHGNSLHFGQPEKCVRSAVSIADLNRCEKTRLTSGLRI